MYNNEIYSGDGTGTNTAGAGSHQNTENKQDAQSTQTQNSQGYQGSSANDWRGSSTSGNSNAFGSSYTSGNNNNSGYNGSYHNDYNNSYSNGYNNSYNSSYSGNNSGNNSSNNSAGNDGRDHKKKKEKKSSGFFGKAITCIGLGLFFGLFAGVGFFGVQQLTGGVLNSIQDETVLSQNVQNQQNAAENLAATEESKSGIKLTDTTQVSVVTSDVTEVVEEVMPAMVSIVNNYTETGTTFFGQSYTQEAASSGTGIIVAESETELLIVSNHHVVSGATKLEVTFIDGAVAEAQIKGMNSDMDLAVIAIPLESLTEETKAAIAISTLGDSDSLKLGEPVIAIGNALGYGQSVTNGIVSALDRELELDEEGGASTFIQTNAAINPGNSGGALLNVKGEVIGINSNKIGATAVEGMGYAIPISAAKPIIADLMLKDTRTKVEDGQVGYIGITMQTVSEQYSQVYNIPMGVCVLNVAEDSPAKEAGLLGGDIIVNFDGEKITTHDDLQEVLQYYGPGSNVSITVKRLVNGEYTTVDIAITLGTRPENQQ